MPDITANAVQRIPLTALIRPVVDRLAALYRMPAGGAPMAMLAAIGLQESGFLVRDQQELQNGHLVDGAIGPATSFWQMERSGGVAGVMTHPATRSAARELAIAAGVPFEKRAIWTCFTTPAGDELAAAFARLLLFTDPARLPEPLPTSADSAWRYYLRNWRPGKPHPERWPGNWRAACDALSNAGSGR